MNTTLQDPVWLVGIITKRTPDVLRVLSELVEAGISRGYCSANDVQSREMAEPNVIGATFKTLKKLGFRQLDERLEPKYRSQHGRKVYKWELVEPQKARQFLTAVRSKLLTVGMYDPQPELF